MLAEPIKDRSCINHEIVNELLLTAIGYLMVLLTGYVVLPQQKQAIGNILLYIVWILLFYNCSNIIVSMILQVKLKLKSHKQNVFIKQ